MEDCDTWRTDEVPDEEIPEPPRVPQRVRAEQKLDVAQETPSCPPHKRKLGRQVTRQDSRSRLGRKLKPCSHDDACAWEQVPDCCRVSERREGAQQGNAASPVKSKANEAATSFHNVSVPLLKSGVGRAPKGGARSVYELLRGQFAGILKEKREVSELELLHFVRARCVSVPKAAEQLLEETAKRCFHLASLRKEGIRVEDWLHFGLLSDSPRWQLNRRLRRELVKNPEFLQQVLNAFETADFGGAGCLQLEDIKASFLDCEELLEEVKLAAKNPGQRQELGYYGFIAYCLGYRRSAVWLNWYDVSRGYAKWLRSFLGQDLEGIWHTGVVAFGREYWFGGKVLASLPGKAPFGTAIRSTLLGSTLQTQEELEDWLRLELVSRYTRQSYDVLARNCNHFSDEVAAFLIEGCHIPDEARRQPEALMGASAMKIVRPILNGCLGGFEAGDSSEIDDLTEEWRARLWPGDLCLYDGGHVKLAQVSKVDVFNCNCEITFFDSRGGLEEDELHAGLQRFAHLSQCWDWYYEKKTVPLSSLRPHQTLGPTGCRGRALLRPGVRKLDPGIQSILTRKPVVYAHCSHGHSMQLAEGQWSIANLLRSKLTCSICSRAILGMDRKLQCSSCGFYLCSACDQKGLFRGYYSLGSVAAAAARQLLEEPEWISYKARRYLAAAGKHGGPLSLEVWQRKLAARLYGDLGQELPSKDELMQQFRSHADLGDGSMALQLTEDQFCALLIEMLEAHSFRFHL